MQVKNVAVASASEPQPEVSRRRFLKTSLITATVASSSIIMPKTALAVPHGEGGLCELSFRNLHTGETFDGAYRVGNKYLLGALSEVNTVLRDFRTGDVFPMDPQLMDIIYTMQKLANAEDKNVEIISGYRSPKTNAMLRGRSSGVAKKSFHMKGQAIDLRIPGISTARLRDIAKSLKAGGVGYYASSDFVHIDTGHVRSW